MAYPPGARHHRRRRQGDVHFLLCSGLAPIGHLLRCEVVQSLSPPRGLASQCLRQLRPPLGVLPHHLYRCALLVLRRVPVRATSLNGDAFFVMAGIAFLLNQEFRGAAPAAYGMIIAVSYGMITRASVPRGSCGGRHVAPRPHRAVLRLPRSRGHGMGQRSTVRFKCLKGRLLPGSCAPCDAAP